MGQKLRFLLLGGLLVQGACDGDSGSGQAGSGRQLVQCDPLTASSEPISLGKVLAVGELNGTLYVATSASGGDDPDRVFVSRDGVLVRKRVLGSGGSGGGQDADFTLSYEDGELPARLVIKRRAGAVVGMALVHDSDRLFFDELPGEAQQLSVADVQSVAGLPLKNLSGEVVIDALASTPDGAMLLLTRPRDDWSDGDQRVFYGHDGVLTERTVVPGSGSRSSRIWLAFQVDGVEFSLQIASEVFSPGVSSTLSTPSGSQILALADVGNGLPEGVTFRCFE